MDILLESEWTLSNFCLQGVYRQLKFTQMNGKIDRKAASKLLKVSIRTVDRYISQNKIAAERIDGRIWLDKKEIQGLKRQKRVDSEGVLGDMSTEEMSIDKTVSTPVDMSIDDVDIVSTHEIARSSKNRQKEEVDIYKKLYEELKEEVEIKQSRLEGANYRVGQLEAMVKESVPLLDHQRLLSTEKAARLELEEETESLREKLERIKKKLKEESLSKKVYFVLLFIIMILQPLWLFVFMK